MLSPIDLTLSYKYTLLANCIGFSSIKTTICCAFLRLEGSLTTTGTS